MKRRTFFGVGLIMVIILVVSSIIVVNQIRDRSAADPSNSEASMTGETILLPDPDVVGGIPLEQAIKQRRSVRAYSQEALSISDVSQILWSAQGITDQTRGLRSVPSAGALYPLEIYLMAGRVIDLDAGIYLYIPQENQLRHVQAGDRRNELYAAALNQQPVLDAPASIIIAAVYQRTRARYGSRAEKYVHLEAGHAGQNISLQVLSLEMATVPIGAFHDQEIKKLIGMPAEQTPLYIFPIGYPSE